MVFKTIMVDIQCGNSEIKSINVLKMQKIFSF